MTMAFGHTELLWTAWDGYLSSLTRADPGYPLVTGQRAAHWPVPRSLSRLHVFRAQSSPARQQVAQGSVNLVASGHGLRGRRCVRSLEDVQHMVQIPGQTQKVRLPCCRGCSPDAAAPPPRHRRLAVEPDEVSARSRSRTCPEALSAASAPCRADPTSHGLDATPVQGDSRTAASALPAAVPGRADPSGPSWRPSDWCRRRSAVPHTAPATPTDPAVRSACRDK